MALLALGFSPRAGAAAIALGLLAAAAFPPLGVWPLTLVAAALFLRLIRACDGPTARNLGLVFGLVYALGTMYWFFGIFDTQAVPLLGIMAAYFGLFATLVASTRHYGPWRRAALVALFAVAVEWLRGDAWYLRFPWYTPVHALAAAPAWIAPARWLGTYGLSYLLWLIAAAGAFGRPWLWAAFAIVPAFSLLLSPVDAPDRRVLLLQSEDDRSVEALIATVPPQVVDLAVLPELAFLRSPQDALALPRGPAALARTVSAPVVFGAIDGDYLSGKFANVAVVIDRAGDVLGTFVKQRPVPLMNDGVPGTERPVFATDQGVLGVAICYDLDAPAVAASLVRSGATVLVVPTLDAISWSRPQHVHHELLLRLRAVENDRWILRAASSGRSEVVDPHGVPSAGGVEIGAVGTVVLPYAHRDTATLGGRLWFLGPAAAALTAAWVVVRLWQSRRELLSLRRARE